MTRSTPPTGPDDIGPDAWLREALRHAPDAEMTVPAAVREAILRQARSAAHESARAVPAPQGGHWRRWVDGWLRPTRLGYSGAFVVLLIAGIWGLEGLDEQAREPLAPSSPEAVMADAAPAIAASAPPPPATLKPAADASTPIVAAAPAKTEPQAPLAPARERPRVSTAASPAPASVPSVLAERAAASDAGSQPAALKAAAPAAARAAAAESGVPAAAPTAMPPGAVTALIPARQDRAGETTPDPLASLLQRATDDATMRWSVGSREGSVGTTQRAWLDALRTATAGRWARASAAPASAAVQLSSPAGLLASLSTSSTPGMLWVVIGAEIYRAPLSEDALARFDEARSGW